MCVRTNANGDGMAPWGLDILHNKYYRRAGARGRFRKIRSVVVVAAVRGKGCIECMVAGLEGILSVEIVIRLEVVAKSEIVNSAGNLF